MQHVPFEDAGSIAEWAEERGHVFDVTMAYTEESPAPDEFDWLVIMGGPMNACSERENPWLSGEKALVRNAIKCGKLVLGVCLGAQIVADVLGGTVTRNPEPEIGWFPVEILTDEPPFDVLPKTFTVAQWHGDTFATPECATHAARSEACENQAFVAADGTVVGLQFHLEWTRPALAALIERCAEDLVDAPWVQQPGELLGAEARFADARVHLFAFLDRMASLA